MELACDTFHWIILCMKRKPSKFIGVIYAKETKEIKAVFNPVYDWQLFDPAHIAIIDGEERDLLKLPREDFPTTATPYFIPGVIKRAKKILKV